MEKEFDGSGTLILSPKELKKGMYVSYLDRPWTDSPFPFQGFVIESEAELKKLRDVCEYVFVDASRGNKNDYQSFYERRAAVANEEPPPVSVPAEAVERPPTEQEFPFAKKVHAQVSHAMIACYDEAAQGRQPQLVNLERAARNLIDSVKRNPDALLYFVRTKTDGDYLYRHGVACAVMLCALGDALGMPYQSLKSLAMGGALLDIGKTRVSSDLLNRPSALELSAGELQQLRRHVERGAEIMSNLTSEGNPIVTMIMSHHERYNGKGYPRRLAGDKIPRFGQMAAIVDMFDAMVSERSYGRRATPYEAVRYIKSQRGGDFAPALVDAFHDAFGTYPTGTLIELNTGEVGFVIQQNRSARLQPRVYLVLDAARNRINEFRVIDLLGQKQICIEKCLKAGSYGIDY